MRFLGTLSACFIAALLVSAHVDPSTKSAYSVTLHPLEKPVSATAKLHLQVTIKNTSDHDILFARTPGVVPDETLSYQIEIHNQRGLLPSETQFFRNLKEKPSSFFGSFVSYTLKPGKSFDDSIEVTRLYTLDKPGKYAIWVARGQLPLRYAPKDIVRSNEITVLVTP